MYITAINRVDAAHLVEVQVVAEKIGYVELNAYFTGDEYFLLEGSHRIEVAYIAQLPLKLRLREWDEEIESDMDAITTSGMATVGEIIDYVSWSSAGKSYRFDDFPSVEITRQ